MTANNPVPTTTAPTLKQWLDDGAELALFDVREHGQYGEGHLFYAVPLPYSRLEIDVARLAPNPAVRVVVYDDDDGIAQRAAAVLARLGYLRVHVLDGGSPAWEKAGFTLYKGVNVPSKTFGELVEVVNHTPHISAQELARRQAGGEALVVLDGRPYAEYQKMSIPGGVCCPNGELALRVDDLAPDPDTTIVVNCAGRTRSIIGAQTLINLGIRNPVVALENGTQGWFLAGLALDHGQQRRYDPRRAAGNDRVAAARELARRSGVEWASAADVRTWAQDPARSLFLCDVRSPEEFLAGSLPGAQSTPGGQLQQATDQYVGVRNATLVLFDDDGVRAAVTASWLGQSGWKVYVLEGGLQGGLDSGLALTAARRYTPEALPRIDAATLKDQMHGAGITVIDLRASQAYREGHIDGSVWSIRPRFGDLGLAPGSSVVLISDDDDTAAWAAADLRALGVESIHFLKGGYAAWRDQGYAVKADAAFPPDAQRIDHLFFTHERHSGNRAAAQQYLDWELSLLSRLDEQERAGFAPLGA